MMPGFIVGGKRYTTTQVGAHSDKSDVLGVMGTSTETMRNYGCCGVSQNEQNFEGDVHECYSDEGNDY
jgi:hypothetical protein